jgi:hypothetical protein
MDERGFGAQPFFRLRVDAVECEGLRIGGVSLLDRRRELNRTTFALPDIDVIEERLWRAYGCKISAAAKLGGLRVVVEALNDRELARAQIGALLLKLPEPADSLEKRLHDCGWLLKEWDADLHPRTGTPPNPGWFAPKDGDAEGERRPRGDQYASNETRTRSDAGGTQTAQAEIAIDPRLLTLEPNAKKPTPEETREKIAAIAQSLVNDQRWADKNQYEIYAPGTNKCSVFVAYVLQQAGTDPGSPNFWARQFTFVPPVAGQWGDPNYTIPGWQVLGPDEIPEPGDIVAQRIAYSDATGHVMIVGEGNTFVGTGDSGNGPHGTIEEVPARSSLANDPRIPHGPLVYRRWVGQ